jgi:serine/threonine-protein kinase
MDTDRNLLFGVLALQADLIDSRQFVEACTLWATRKHVPLADLLLERGWIVPADRAHLEYLLERKLQRGGGLANLADDVKRSLAALDDGDIQRSLAAPAATDPAATIADQTAPPGRYTLVRLHATGGIGRVWLARDPALGRDVALKELRPERAGNAALGTRFLKEARITGQLEHPGIVPVYELARRPQDDQPFYTMRFVRGRTLTEAAHEHHQRRLAGQAEPLELLTLLQAFVTVCNTVAYAHSRGVIHRDLKGQNVILGDFGEVVVLDWGLAKLVGRDEDVEAASIVLGIGAEGSDHTVQGQAVGTPAYMAPEQAAGRLDLIDRRTDVYGLGAILYEVLTGRPPFTGADTYEVLRRVQEEEPVPPRQCNPEVPAELEAVCLRALAKRPAERYAGAGEPAQAVQQWMAELAERKRAEQAREHFFGLSLDLLVIAGFDGYFKEVNPAWEKTLGWSRAELLARPWLDFVHPDDRAMTMAATEQIVVGGELPAHENRYLCKDGSYRWLQWTARLIAGQDAIYGVARDITERRRAEEELRRSRERFELAVLGSQDGLWDWDVEADEVWYSPHLKRMLGYDDREFLNQAGETEKRVHPDDQPRWRAALDAHVAGLTDHYELEYRMRHRDGSYRWVRDRGVALRHGNGKAYRMAGSREDITERKGAAEALRASEERYRSVIAAMQDGMVLLDAGGGILACNASAERILGLSADQMMGRTPLDPRWGAVHEDGTPFPGEEFPASLTLRTGQPCSDVVMGVHKPDGTLTWISVNSRPLFRADGTTLAGVAASFEDITYRKQLEEELACARAHLRQTSPQGCAGATMRAGQPCEEEGR